MLDLANIIADFAAGLKRADAKCPQAVNVRTKKPFQPGIGLQSDRSLAPSPTPGPFQPVGPSVEDSPVLGCL